MEKYNGMNFKEWCALDESDERKINYTLRGVWDRTEHTERFTSDDEVDLMMLFRVQNSIIEKIELINNEWHATLIYY